MPSKKKITINWELSLRCNLDCSFCSQQERRYDQKDEISYDDAIKIINNLPKNAHISFLWGETLLFKKIQDIFNYLESTSITYEITTNGSLLDKYYSSLVEYNNLSQINISIDGYWEKHDTSRWKKKLFDTIIHSIKKISWKKNIFVSTVVTSMSDSNLVQLYELLNILWVQEQKLIYCMNFTDQDIENSKQKVPTIQVWKPGAVDISEKEYKKDFLKKFLLLKKVEKQTKVSFEPSWIFSKATTHCKQIDDQFRINEKGQITVCEFIKNSFLSLIDNDFSKAVKESRYRKILNDISKKFPLEICTTCCKKCIK